MDTRILCLGVLSRGDASGYEITKACETGPFGHFHETSFGSVYPALNRLHAEGLVHCTAMAQEKRPDKKVYSITEAGRNAFAHALAEPPADDRIRSEFLFMLFFSHLLAPERAAALIDDRIAGYDSRGCCLGAEELAELKPGERFVHGFGVAVHQAAADYLRANRDRFLAELDANRDTRESERDAEAVPLVAE